MSGVVLTSRREKTIVPRLTSWLDRAAETEKNPEQYSDHQQLFKHANNHRTPWAADPQQQNKTNQCSSSAAGDVMFHFSSFNKSAVNAFLRLFSCFQLDQGVQCVCMCVCVYFIQPCCRHFWKVVTFVQSLQNIQGLSFTEGRRSLHRLKSSSVFI